MEKKIKKDEIYSPVIENKFNWEVRHDILYAKAKDKVDKLMREEFKKYSNTNNELLTRLYSDELVKESCNKECSVNLGSQQLLPPLPINSPQYEGVIESFENGITPDVQTSSENSYKQYQTDAFIKYMKSHEEITLHAPVFVPTKNKKLNSTIQTNKKDTVLTLNTKNGTELLRFEDSGDIYIKGEFTTNDFQIVEGFREYLKQYKLHP